MIYTYRMIATDRKNKLGGLLTVVDRTYTLSGMKKNPIILRLAKKMGSQAAMARHLGITRGAVNQWREVPVAYVIPLEKATGINRTVICPRFYPLEK